MHKILLAEDDNDMRRFLVKALENAGFQVSPHDNGMSAYQRLREEPFEMLLTDIVMPEMDGIELARRASELDPDIKIMFITGFAAVALNADSTAPKHAKVLSKPIHLRDLVNGELHYIGYLVKKELARPRKCLLFFRRKGFTFGELDHRFQGIRHLEYLARRYPFSVPGVTLAMIARDFDVFPQEFQ
jgi:two-component system cell cycle response regulator CpdR